MNNKIKLSFLGLLIASIFLVSSCKKNDSPTPDIPDLSGKGVYILNQGTGADDSELSYFDYSTSEMINDFFVAANPDRKLGSGANDMGIYGSKLYITVDGSNKVEILNSTTGKVIKTVNIDKSRFITFHGGHAFVTSHTDKVFVIDTATYAIVKEIPVGRTPEQLAVSGNKIFVANSGWQDYVFNDGEHDNTVSVIDANTLEVIETVEVVDNIVNVYADNNDHVFINAQAIYNWPTLLHPSRLYVMNANSLEIEKDFEYGAEFMAFHNDHAYLFTSDDPSGETRFLHMDTKSLSTQNQSRFENTAVPFGLGVDPVSGDTWVADAGDFGAPGTVYYHNASTKVTESYTTGVSPSKFAFK